jgi:tRNA pseudouridine38-40 synthase
MRVKAVISYDGNSFEGFQRQKRTKNTVTTAIEDALSSLRIESKVVGSGRTDAKVHATGQVIHFDIPYFWQEQPLEKLKQHLNRRFQAIFIKKIERVDSDFHARFNAKRRQYRYIFKQKRVNIFERNYISELPIDDIELFQEAINYFVGEHDFIFLSKTGSDVKTTVRTIYKTALRKRKNYYFLYIEGDGFLRAQIRAMIHLALEFANRNITLDEFLEQLNGKRRHSTGLVTPYGLYLARVWY